MPQQIIQKFEIPYLQVLDELGNCDEKLKPKELTDEKLVEIYRLMVTGRKLDEKMFSLQRQGRLGTIAQGRGHEAAQIGAVGALDKDDWAVPYFRHWLVHHAMGHPMEMILQYNAGDERGMKIPDGVNLLPICVPVATQIPHATGLAWGLKMKGKKSAVLCFLGDGATSEGDFHEGLNFAGVFRCPIVFVCENNQYAISVPREKQSASATLAQKAIAYGFDGIQVDGNDVMAMFKAVKEALAKAREGKPTLIEAVTYRLADHTTADDATRYRTQQELDGWKKKDPVDRVRLYLAKRGAWSKSDEEQLLKETEKKVEEAVARAEKIPPPDPKDMFAFMYAEMTPELKEQCEDVFGRNEKREM